MEKKKLSVEARQMIWILLIAFGIRTVLTMLSSGYPYDTGTFSAWAGALAENGMSGFYAPDYFADYPPGYMVVLWGVGNLTKLLGIDFGTASFYFVLTFVPMACDIVLALILYRVAAPVLSSKSATILSLFVAFNPALIFDCAIWKQVDSVLTVFLLLSFLYLTQKKPLRAAIFYGFALLIKPQALLFGPAFALVYVLPLVMEPDKKDKLVALKNLVLGVVASVGTVLLVSLPFTGSQTPFVWLWDKYFSTMGSYPYATINAFNCMGFLGGEWKQDSERFLFFSWKVWGNIALILLLAALVYLGVKSWRNKRFNPLLLAAFFGGGVFTLMHNMHERYLFPVIVLLFAAYIYLRDKRILASGMLFSAVMLVNMCMVQFNVDGDQFLASTASQAVMRITGLVETLTFLWLGWVCWQLLCKGIAVQENVLPAAVLKTKKNKKQHAPVRPLSPPAPVPTWAKRDTIALVALTLLTAAFSLPYLGTTHVPQKGLYFTGQTVEVTFDREVQVDSVWVYGGLPEDSELSITNETGAQVFSTTMNYGNPFSWQVTTGSPFTAQSLSITMNAGTLNEIAFEDAGGNTLVPASISAGGEALFDEADTVPERPTQLNGMYFDEIYHARTAYETLTGHWIYETTHPPLGKDIIAIGIALFGMNPFGWRIMGTLFGIAMVPVFYLLTRRLLRRFPIVLCTSVLFAFDFMRYTQSRIATIDVFVVLFVLLGAYFMVWFCQEYLTNGPEHALLPAALGGVAFGLGCAAKWTGIYAGAGLAILYFLAIWRRRRIVLAGPGKTAAKERTCSSELMFCLKIGVLFYVCIPLVIYILSYVPLLFEKNGNFTFSSIWQMQKTMFSYHSTLKATHPFESKWYSWPLILRPVWYYSGKMLPDGIVASIAALGNPLVWWGGTAGILWLLLRTLRRKGDTVSATLLILYAAQLVPWMLVTRATFIYHYFASMCFALLAFGTILAQIWDKHKKVGEGLCIGCCAIAVGLFIYFYPVLSGLPISTAYAASMKWLDGWGFYIL